MHDGKLFSDEEERFLADERYFRLKLEVVKKISSLYNHLYTDLHRELHDFSSILPAEVLTTKPKISRGENYLGFPWLILDYPRIFSKEDVFAFRSLCWFGNEFSFTLHLSGRFFSAIQPQLASALWKLEGNNYYICNSDSPWNYHFNNDNYVLTDDAIKHGVFMQMKERNFLKLSRRLDISKTDDVRKFATTTFTELVKALY